MRNGKIKAYDCTPIVDTIPPAVVIFSIIPLMIYRLGQNVFKVWKIFIP